MDNTRENRIYEFEDFRLDAAHRLLYRNDEEVSLSPKAIETLLALIERPGEVISKHELMETIWANTVVEESNLAQYLHLLRKTLGKHRDGKPYIETLKRRGYRFNGAVRVSESVEGHSQRSREQAAKSTSTKELSELGHRVERHGNVLALVDWKENRREDVEPTTAIAEPSSRTQQATRFGLRPALAAMGGVLLLIVVTLVWLKAVPEKPKSDAKNELTFLTLTNGEPLDFATISPDGNYFVYTTRDDELAHLWLQQTGQATRTEIIPPFAGGIYGTTFTPDSKFIYYVAGETPGTPYALFRVPALGGVRTKILSDIATPVSVSPDGRELVFARLNQKASSSSIVIASSDGMRERVLLTRSGDDAIGNSAWSPDGKWIAYGALSMKGNEGQCTISGIDPATEEIKSLSPERWDTCYRMAWTRDGKGLVFPGTKFREAFSTRRDQIFYLSIDSGESRRLTTEGNRHQYASLGVTDRDEILVVPFNRSSQIWSMDAGGDSRTAVQITTGQADGRSGIQPLSDGRLSYLTRNRDGFSIWLINADGTDRKQLTTEPPEIEELRADPDGRYFVFSAKLDRLSHLYRVDANGANLKQLTFGETHELDSDVSPDGKWIVYHSTVFNGSYGKAALWKVPSEGGEPVLLADINCATPHYSPDGRFVSCVSDREKGTISIVSAYDGTTIANLGVDQNALLHVGSNWTRDGKALAYISFYKNVSNIWIQPINGEPRYRLTDFTSGDIYNFAFGATDSRLYLARGHSIRNAILISNFK